MDKKRRKTVVIVAPGEEGEGRAVAGVAPSPGPSTVPVLAMVPVAEDGTGAKEEGVWGTGA